VSEKVIDMRDVTVRYHEQTVLEEIQFSVSAGEIVSIVGPNGSGKTTLVKTMLGFVKPYTGQVFVLGQQVGHIVHSGQIGYLPQGGLYKQTFPVSVFDVVAMSVYAQKTLPVLTGPDKRRILAALDQVDMKGYAHRFFGSLSGGQKQRVLIARALVLGPKILILDEPSTGLDAVAQDTFYKMLIELRDRINVAIVMVSHDVGAVSRFVDTIACLNRRIHFHGKPGQGVPEEKIRKVFGENVHFLFHDERCETCRRRCC